MNTKISSLNWNYVKAFLATAETGSLSAAARALNTSQPTIGRQITALESDLKVALFERSGRGPELTPTGTELLQYVRDMHEAADRFSVAAAGQSDSIKGSVAITANEVTAAFFLPPIIERLKHAEPDIEIELIASNTSTDLKRREADIAVRGYRPTQAELICKKVYEGDAGLYASREYIQNLDGDNEIEKLRSARFVASDRGAEYLLALSAVGADVALNQFSIYCENHLVQWELIKQGVCVGILANEVGGNEARLARILAKNINFPYELWLTSHRELRTSARIRRVFDFLAQEIQSISNQPTNTLEK